MTVDYRTRKDDDLLEKHIERFFAQEFPALAQSAEAYVGPWC